MSAEAVIFLIHLARGNLNCGENEQAIYFPSTDLSAQIKGYLDNDLWLTSASGQ